MPEPVVSPLAASRLHPGAPRLCLSAACPQCLRAQLTEGDARQNTRPAAMPPLCNQKNDLHGVADEMRVGCVVGQLHVQKTEQVRNHPFYLGDQILQKR